MAHSEDQLFKHATQIAERHIRAARSHQSRVAASLALASMAWLASKVWTTEAAATSRQ